MKMRLRSGLEGNSSTITRLKRDLLGEYTTSPASASLGDIKIWVKELAFNNILFENSSRVFHDDEG